MGVVKVVGVVGIVGGRIIGLFLSVPNHVCVYLCSVIVAP